jgi:hypothetical protein
VTVLRCEHCGRTSPPFPPGTIHAGLPILDWFQRRGRRCKACHTVWAKIADERPGLHHCDAPDAEVAAAESVRKTGPWRVESAPRARQPAARRAPPLRNGGENDQWLDREVELPLTRMIKVRKRYIGPDSIRLIHSGGDRRGFLVRTARWA